LQNLGIEILNRLNNLGARPGIRLIEKDLAAWRRKTFIIISGLDRARGWGKGFVSTSTIGTGGFKRSEVIKFVIMIRVVSSPTTWTSCAAGSTGVKPEGAMVEVSDGTARFAVCHSEIPLPLEVFYLLIAGSKGFIGFFEGTFESTIPVCEFCCISAISLEL
jgi:hypothetical protein